MKFDAVIIGSGPAGLSAAVYLRRAMLSVAVVEKEYMSGGQILLTEKVENYLGFESISGFELADKFRKHAENLGAEFIKGEVTDITPTAVTLKKGDIIETKAVIIAAGAKHKAVGAVGEKELSGRGVSYCAVCDGAFFKDRAVVVVGGGDTALEDAIYLAGVCKKVTLIHRRDELRGAKVLQEKFFSLDNTEFVPSDEIQSFNGDKKLESVTLKSGKSISADGAFIAIGQVPNTEFIKGRLELAKDGSIVTDEECRTNIDGIFAVGDVRNKSCRQITTAVADGAIASKSVLGYLNSKF